MSAYTATAEVPKTGQVKTCRTCTLDFPLVGGFYCHEGVYSPDCKRCTCAAHKARRREKAAAKRRWRQSLADGPGPVRAGPGSVEGLTTLRP
jgi:hypothetical protein